MQSVAVSTTQSAAKRPQRALFRRLLALTTLLAIFATACGGGTSTAEVAATPEATDANVGGVLEGEFETFSGEGFNLADAQNKDTVFWFWAPW